MLLIAGGGPLQENLEKEAKRLEIPVDAGEVIRYGITDLTGHEILSHHFKAATGGRQLIDLPLETLEPGIYMVWLESGSQRYTQKLVLLE